MFTVVHLKINGAGIWTWEVWPWLPRVGGKIAHIRIVVALDLGTVLWLSFWDTRGFVEYYFLIFLLWILTAALILEQKTPNAENSVFWNKVLYVNPGIEKKIFNFWNSNTLIYDNIQFYTVTWFLLKILQVYKRNVFKLRYNLFEILNMWKPYF